MVRIKSSNDIILSSLDFYRNSQPLADFKPGSVARDLLIDGPSTQLARLYEELARIQTAQSLRLSLGQDLDRLGQNFGATRKRGSVSSGVALLTWNEFAADIPINAGDIITANNGATFRITASRTISPVFANTYRATASRFRSDLDFVNITDQFAVEVTVECTVTGRIGNISRYALSTVSTFGISNVTNAQAFGGGSEAEDDAAFRNRVLSIFSGAQAGTKLGYENIIREDPAVLDVIVVGPGDTLMTRDGTQVSIAEDGTRTIIADGTGGKIDIYIYGFRLVEILDSFIYRDQSNRGDPTDPANDFVLGQIEGDENKTVTRKRLENLENEVLPSQPVNDIISVVGSSSGANFIEKSVDSLGRISGNYELIRDDGAFAGSPWGFDRLRFVDDQIRDFIEDQTKGRFNGQDLVTFSDVTEISAIEQDIQIINENSQINSSNRSSIQLAHYPVRSVTRVFNLTTGERYVISNQNPDGSSSGLNETGRITIRGNTLPAISDILQVDYTWVFNYDPNFDFDNKVTTDNPREVVDSIDWGLSNSVSREESTVAVTGSLSTVTVTHSISSVISVNTFTSQAGVVQLVSGRLAVVLSTTISNVVSVKRDSDGAELFDTSREDGSISGLTAFLPTDTVAEFGDVVTVIYNAVDVFTTDDGVSGSFDQNVITLSTSASVSAGTLVEVNYIANVRTLLPTTLLPALPAIREGNGFKTSSVSQLGVQPTTHVFSGTDIIESNLRKAPSRLQLTVAGTISPGVITVTGTTFTGVFDAVFTVVNSGLRHNLAESIKDALDIASSSSVPSTVEVVKITKVEKVTANDNFDVLSVDHNYDIKGYQLRNNNYVKADAITNSSLSTTQFELPSTFDNEENSPNIGETLRVTFHFATNSDSENISFSKAGSLYTQKIFAIINTIAISSGFISGPSQSASLTVSNQNQPSQGTRYSTTYDYIAPKTNERISIRYNHNKLITDTTLALEPSRTIGADVLNKASTPILVDVTMAIVVTSAFENATTVVRQNVQDAITSALTASKQGTVVDESDLQNVAYTVEGVDRVRPVRFNIAGETGRVLSIQAEKNEYILPNDVVIEIETR